VWHVRHRVWMVLVVDMCGMGLGVDGSQEERDETKTTRQSDMTCSVLKFN